MKMPGPYVPLDVNYARDRAIAAAGEEAELLYVRALAYCKHTFSDGFIPDYDIDEVAKRLKRVPARISALIREGLWAKTDGGWLIRNWNRWNESTEDVIAKRERDAERQRKRRGQKPDGTDCPSDVTANVQRDTAVTPGGVTAPKARQGKAETEQGKTLALRADTFDEDPTGRLLAEHSAAYKHTLPPSALAPVRREVMRLVAEGVEPERISAGLAKLREKQLAASLLPQLVTECERPSTTNARVATGLALVEKYREQEAR